MKKLIVFLITFTAVFVLPGCKKFVEGYEVSPNNPLKVTLPTLMASAQGSIFWTYNGDMARILSMWMQYQDGIDRQYAGYSIYRFTESDVDNLWRSFYYEGLMDLNQLDKQARAEGQNSLYFTDGYIGISNVLRSMMMMQITDLFDRVPMSQAFKGEENLSPAYDTQDQVYQQVNALLNEAIVKLQVTPPARKLTPGSDDYIFNGDLSKWLNIAYLLKARMHMHYFKATGTNLPTGNAAMDSALAALDRAYANGFASSADNMNAKFDVNNYTASNPWYQFMQERGDIATNSNFEAMLTNLNDPRLAVYSEGGTVGTFFQENFLPMATFAEAKFIEAEAALRTGNIARAKTAYVEGIEASMATYPGISGTAIADYLAQPSVDITGISDTQILLERIMTQKYIALYIQPETFNDWRRTGFPVLNPKTGNVTNNVIPRRFPTPISERTYNGANAAPIISDITQRVSWDRP
ncbi:MAG: SusD/RagB family nutrient-binding outer membrane lipoprotein [Bacteroidia bacterium]|nr:SusD/RagB family nutrient-binding outer membrane lipoprotein [Bacteroidia bacterium]